MKYLITGGCGFLGSNIAARILQQKSGEVTLVDNLSRVGSEQNLLWLHMQGKLAFHQVNTFDFEDLSRVIKDVQPDVIFHFAGQVAMTTSIANPRLDFNTNVLGSFNVLEAVRQFAPQCCVIFSSTNKVYGDLEQYTYREEQTRYACVEHPNGFDENTPLEFHSPYGCSKGAADQYMLDWARMFGLKTAVFRHSSMYGSRQFGTFDQGWISWFCQKAVETEANPATEFTIAGNGKQVRDVLHAQDMADLYLAAAAQIDKIKGQAFNIGGGIQNSLSLLELFALLEEMLHLKLHYTQLPPRQSDQKFFVADITKATRLLGWEPHVSKEQGIAQMIAWIKQLKTK